MRMKQQVGGIAKQKDEMRTASCVLNSGLKFNLEALGRDEHATCSQQSSFRAKILFEPDWRENDGDLRGR